MAQMAPEKDSERSAILVDAREVFSSCGDGRLSSMAEYHGSGMKMPWPDPFDHWRISSPRKRPARKRREAEQGVLQLAPTNGSTPAISLEYREWIWHSFRVQILQCISRISGAPSFDICMQ